MDAWVLHWRVLQCKDGSKVYGVWVLNGGYSNIIHIIRLIGMASHFVPIMVLKYSFVILEH